MCYRIGNVAGPCRSTGRGKSDARATLSEAFSSASVTWMGLAKTIFTTASVVMAVGGVIWSVSGRVVAMSDQVTRQEQRIAEIAATVDARTAKGEAERQRVEAASVARHQQQQAEIDRLRLQAEGFSSNIAVISDRLSALLEMVREVRADVRAGATRPPTEAAQITIQPLAAVPPSRLDRLAPPAWGTVPPTRGVR